MNTHYPLFINGSFVQKNIMNLRPEQLKKEVWYKKKKLEPKSVLPI